MSTIDPDGGVTLLGDGSPKPNVDARDAESGIRLLIDCGSAVNVMIISSKHPRTG
jgi:hypothetical protein